jgi:hypothetical protein
MCHERARWDVSQESGNIPLKHVVHPNTCLGVNAFRVCKAHGARYE